MLPAETVRVLFLGPLRLELQHEACDVPFPAPGGQDELWAKLAERYPQLEAARATTRLARGTEFLEPKDGVMPGDEIALIPPVSGG